MRVQRLNRPLFLLVLFNLFFMSVIYFEPNSSSNFARMGATLQNTTIQFKILLNIFFVFVIIILYKIIRFVFESNLLKSAFIQNYHKLLLGLSVTIFCFIPASVFLGPQNNIIDSYFRIFGVGHLEPNFIDLRGTLAAINKVKEVGEGYQIDCQIKPCIGWRWTYGSSILQLKKIGIFTEHNTHFFALLLYVLFLIIILKISNDFKSSIVFLLLIPTGTFMLIIERMNIDVILILLIYYLALSTTNTKLLFAAPILILIAASVKYYPLVLIIPLFFIIKSKLFHLYLILVFLFGIIYIIPKLKLAGISNFSYGYSATYGLKNFIGIVTGASHPKLQINLYIWLFAIFFAYITLFTFRNFKFPANLVSLNVLNLNLYIFGFTILFSSWILNSNYPYRLICVLCMIPYLVNLYEDNKEIVLASLSSIIICFGTIAVTLTPVRNFTLSVYVAFNLGILTRIFFKYLFRLNLASFNYFRYKIPKNISPEKLV